MDGTEAISTRGVLLDIFYVRTKGEASLMNLFSSRDRSEKPYWLRPQIIFPGREPVEPPKEEWCPYKTL